MKWYTSDLHLGHNAIIRMNSRPFTNTQEMNREIIANFNKRVRPQDEVYFLGDMSHHLEAEEAEKLIKQLNGRKHLIIGNHDKYFGSEFLTVEPYAEVMDMGYTFILEHYPLATWKHIRRENVIMVHGHIHSGYSYNLEMRQNGIRRFDCGVDCCGFYPTNSKEIINFFKNNMDIPYHSDFRGEPAHDMHNLNIDKENK